MSADEWKCPRIEVVHGLLHLVWSLFAIDNRLVGEYFIGKWIVDDNAVLARRHEAGEHKDVLVISWLVVIREAPNWIVY